MTEKRTALYDSHVAAGARMTPFAGWSMPLNYGSQIAEHHAVRQGVGIFDVSHMAIVDIDGDGARDFLRRVFANNPAKAKPGRAVYGTLLNEDGGIIDDLMLYGRDGCYRAVVNAGTRDKVLGWLRRHAEQFAVRLRERADMAMLAVQGPKALDAVAGATGIDAAALAPFSTLEDGAAMVARTGYTGEDGVEMLMPAADAPALWDNLLRGGAVPAGLAARDTLRLEAGLNLYGQDMDETTTPLESNLGWTVAWKPEDRDFVGRAALARQRAEKPARVFKGLVLEGRGVMRHGCRVDTGAGAGVVTSGVFSPTLGYSIALARLPRGAKGDCTVELRGKATLARIVRPPFVRHGERVFEDGTERAEN